MSSSNPERAFLAIADVSGYTSYLAGVELDHAQDILSDLTVTVVEALAPFQLLKLEGDAAFAYFPGEQMDGSTLQDTVEGTYIAFRNRLRDIKQATTCECDACVRIPDLDLKIVIHQGTIGRQKLMGLEELVGAEVILVHRLLKNEVQERTGIKAYALYTQAVVQAASIDVEAQGLQEHREQTDVAGEVIAWISDLDAAWQRLLNRPRLTIPDERQWQTWVIDWDAPPQVVFDFITSPQRRPLWDESIDAISESSPDGRRGTGTVNHCMHGENAIAEEILDWRPPEYWLTRTTLPGGDGGPQFLKSEEFVRTPSGGTRYELILGSIEGRTPVKDQAVRSFVTGNIVTKLDQFTASITEAIARIDDGSDQKPELPDRPGRFLTEPISN